MVFGQIVIGPAGSGKTTYCNGMSQFLNLIGRLARVAGLRFLLRFTVSLGLGFKAQGLGFRSSGCKSQGSLLREGGLLQRPVSQFPNLTGRLSRMRFSL